MTVKDAVMGADRKLQPNCLVVCMTAMIENVAGGSMIQVVDEEGSKAQVCAFYVPHSVVNKTLDMML